MELLRCAVTLGSGRKIVLMIESMKLIGKAIIIHASRNSNYFSFTFHIAFVRLLIRSVKLKYMGISKCEFVEEELSIE